jgi:hypothetical protein
MKVEIRRDDTGMIKLSLRTKKLLETLFPDVETRELVGSILVNECADNIPLIKNSSPEGMERIRFSVLKISAGDLQKFDEAVKLASLDWRDLFMAAGFGHEVDAHNKWYEETVEG